MVCDVAAARSVALRMSVAADLSFVTIATRSKLVPGNPACSGADAVDIVAVEKEASACDCAVTVATAIASAAAAAGVVVEEDDEAIARVGLLEAEVEVDVGMVGGATGGLVTTCGVRETCTRKGASVCWRL